MVLSNAQWFANPGVVYEIDESCRFNRADSAYMYQTPGGAASSARLGTISVWIKRAGVTTQEAIIDQHRSDGLYDGLIFNFNSDGVLNFAMEADGGAVLCKRATTQVFRDPGAWYHIVIGWDSNQTDDTCCTMYVNGEAVTAFGTKTNFGSAQDLEWLNTSKAVSIGRSQNAANYCDMYMSQFAVIDGSKLTASSFGETNSTTGQWVPKDITGLTYGNEGWLFAFQDSSALGDDTSGNGNDFTSSGLAAADQMTDSPTNNFSTMSPLGADGGTPTADWTFSDGNLVCTKGTAGSWDGCFSTFDIPKTGKWAFKWTWDSGTYATATVQKYGATDGTTTNQISWEFSTGQLRQDTTVTSVSISTGDNAEYLVDMDNGTCKIYKNGSLEATFTSLTTSTLNQFGLWSYGANVFTVEFDYTPSDTDYSTLCTANLPDPTIADPSGSFQTTLYTGDGSTQSIDQGGNKTFSPDFVWIKNRSADDSHCLFDTVRGVTELLSSDNTDVEATDADTLTAFDSDGFTVGADVKVNTSGENYVGWQWLADESWSSGASGTRIASSGVRNTTMGFSIASWTHQTSANYNIAHGLSARPGFFTTKCLEQATNWGSWHQDQADVAKRLILNTTSAETTGYWSDPTDNTDITSGEYPVTSTLFGFQHDTFNDTHPLIAYFFTEVEGFSKFGSYTSNNDADGPFIWCGFKPAYLLLKCAPNETNWEVRDSARSPYNVASARLLANNSSEEDSASTVDLLSNGFKLVAANVAVNPAAALMLFAAFAESPFQTATAR